MRKWNGSMIMCIEKLLCKHRELKIQKQRFSKGRKIWDLLKRRDGKRGSPTRYSSRCWMPSEIVWAMLQVLTIMRISNMRTMMKKIHSWAPRSMMTNPAGWWAQSPTLYSNQWKFSSEAEEAWWIDASGMVGRGRLLLWEWYEVWYGRMGSSGSWSAPHKQGSSCTWTDNTWNANGDSW